MKFIKISVLCFLFLFNPAHLGIYANDSLYSQKDLAVAKSAIQTALKSDLAWDFVSSLTKEVGPRPAGSISDKIAVAWSVNQLNKMGFDRVWTEPVRVTAWKRGFARAEIKSNPARTIEIAALGGSVSTPDSGVTAEIQYYTDFNSLKMDKSLRAKNKIVFIDGKMRRTPDGSGYGEAVSGRFMGAVEAAKRGAVAVIVRSIGTDDHGHAPHTGTMRYEDGAVKIPAVAVSNSDANVLAELYQQNKNLVLYLNTQNISIPNLESANVLAEIQGSEKPEQIVAIGGHLDSWDLGTGAVDDGAGIAITVATLKILRDISLKLDVKPKRTIRVVLFANEENGLDGAFEYSRVHGKEKHQLVSESDLGAGAIYRFDTYMNEESRLWLNELASLLKPLKITWGDNEGTTGADLGTVADRHGFAQAQLRQDASEYFDYHHSAEDTLDKINPKNLKQNVAAWTAMVWLAAQAGVDFTPPEK